MAEKNGRDVPKGYTNASHDVTVPPALIAEIRLKYRLSKSAEKARMTIDQKLASHALVYLTAWNPNADESEREKFKRQAARVVSAAQKRRAPKPEDEAIFAIMVKMVRAMEPARETFEAVRKVHHRVVEGLVKELPAYQFTQHVNGFGAWGLGTIIGEAGDIGAYSGCRKLFKRLGLAPKESYPRGEKSTGRMIPRKTLGRMIGVIFDPLLKAKAKNAYGAVYDQNKARHLAAGKTKGHAHALARRAMVKALIHDVHRAWHGLPPDYVFKGDEASQKTVESQIAYDRPSPAHSLKGSGASRGSIESQIAHDRPASPP